MNTHRTGMDALLERVGLSNVGIWGESERSYLEYVDAAMHERRNEVFGNSRPLHAVYLIFKFFAHAKKEVRIFSGKLRQREYDQLSVDRGLDVYANRHVLAAVGAFLANEGARLKIVVDEGLDDGTGQIADSAEGHPLVKKVKALGDRGRLRGSCEIARLDPVLLQRLKDEDRHYHLMIMDRSAYRLETDSVRAEAYVNANDEDLARELARFFDDSLWSGASKLWNAPSVAG